MSNSTSRLTVYRQNQVDKKRNLLKYIPFSIERLNNYIPGFIPGIMYKITSHTGNGKTQFAKYLVFSSIANALLYKKKFKCIYIALEESKEEFEDSLYLYVINVVLKVPMSYYDLLGYSNRMLTEAQLEALANAERIVNGMKEYVEIIDDAYTSTDIYNSCKKYANKFGEVDEFFESFTPDEENKDTVFMVVVDHISLIKDTGSTTFDSMANWHTNIAKRIITKKWRWVCINVQQQNIDSDKAMFNAKGQLIMEKLIPSIDGLGDNRTVSRDDYVIMALFSPARYRINEFNGYQIGGSHPHSLGDNFRILYILKNRLGTPNKQINLYFDGSCSYFQELPPSKEDQVVSGFLRKVRNDFNKNSLITK